MGQKTTPDAPVLNYVSVDTSGYTHFNWQSSDSSSVVAYIIYIFVWGPPQETILIDTIPERETISFVWEESWGNIKSESYSILAITSTTGDAGEGGISNLAPTHTTIFLELNFDSCEGAMNLDWNAYGGWGDSLSYYTLYKKANYGEFIPISLNDNELSYVDDDVVPYVNYCYYVEASHKYDERTSTSNMACETSNMPRPPKFLYANGTEFIADKQVKISFTVDTDTELDTYHLIRSESVSGVYDTIEIKIQANGGLLTFQDEIEDEIPYYYQLLSMNSCGLVAKRSNISSTIQLTAVNAGSNNLLSWNSYMEWTNGVGEYEIYRSVDGGNIEFLPPGPEQNDTSYTDNVEDLILNSGAREFCYYLTATEEEGNPYGTGFSQSNTKCVLAESNIYIANTFTPNGDGLNDEFKPLLTFAPKDYMFIIRNRVGNTIFKTDDPEIPWKGDLKGKPVPGGTYIYFLQVEDQEGMLQKKTGQVMVLYPEN